MGKRKRESEVFQVEVILGARVNEDSEWEYKIRWAGYGEDDDSWEPEDNIQKNCERLIKSFWEDVGMDNEDYYPGYECESSQEWRAREKTRFWKDEKRKKKAKDSLREPKKIKQEPSDDDGNVILSIKRPLRVSSSDSESDVRSTLIQHFIILTGEPYQMPLSSQVTFSKGKGKNKEPKPQPEKRPQESPASPTSLFSECGNDVPSSPDKARSSPSPPPPLPPPPSAQTTHIRKPKGLKLDIPNIPVDSKTPQSATSASANPVSATNAPGSPNPSSTVKLPGFLRQKRAVANEAPISSGSNLSVKSRLAQTSYVPTNPKKPTATDPQRDKAITPASAATKKSSLGNLNFKKKPAPIQASPTITPDDMNFRVPSYTSPIPTSVSPQIPSFATTSTLPSNPLAVPAHEPTMTALNALPSPTSSRHEPISDAPMTMSPTEKDQSTDFTRPKSPLHQAAETFLQGMMFPEMAAPLDPPPTVENEDDMALPTRTSLTGKPAISGGKIPKKWRWTGNIEIQEGDQPELLCVGVISDAIQLVPGGMPLRVVLTEDVDAVCLRTFLPIELLDEVLLASKPMEAVGCLSSDEGAGSLVRFCDYLQSKKQVAFSPVEVDGMHTANFICYPTGLALPSLQIPPELSKGVGLVVALLPWKLSREERSKDWRVPANDLQEVQYLVSDEQLLSSSHLRHAVGLLKYPDWLDVHMRVGERQYAIWIGENGEPNATVDLEAGLLMSILEKRRATRKVSMDSQDPLKVIFIHAQALGSLSKIPLLKQKREIYELMFVVFGTRSSDVAPAEYPSGMWEIFPIGGIVSFTAKALHEHPAQILDRIHVLADHPLWDCYILPTVFGMAVKLRYKDENPLEAFDNGQFAYQFLLDAIHEGDIGLFRCPPTVTNVTTTHWRPTDDHADTLSVLDRHNQDSSKTDWRDPRSDWLVDQMDIVFRERRETLEFCLEEFQRLYGHIPPTKWDILLQNEIAEDLGRIQLQPGIMREYRRYVVLKGEEERAPNDEFEWVSPDQFHFQDDTDNGVPHGPPDSPPPLPL
ncbi:hypothetical protein AAF712_006991 [Marasmius tenuissimus]|uniref:Chromo domain-containing protein n=1 Tax=Marasmius tenuissimus TaxID=585030 RepID=A0ABR2ZY48_9AGAR